ncbi:MAG: class I SAM-dependent methyltransferase [Actinobacteria bacterium]|nr:class I SAM-dependent methyltransferase [Actinomycetota bacterium]MCG2820110.1 class I SAM-dependent methyltransferase [Actinomycetes bacterium]MBU4179522.1 class I SAM-dependent methyltransferase [Actinomycetota bacterium]MBU4219896.1 class I SAM-dependent methyltransferase [Actinomycetota bacterium]MBU4359786.1 class I SAM-dependent methyltransferase [Actinomycetota bacterium]
MTREYRHGGWDEWLQRLEGKVRGAPEVAWLDRIADRVLDKARLRRGDSVVDLGTGHGLLAMKAARAVGPGGTVVALDSDPGCLDELRRRRDSMSIRSILTVVGRMEDLPLESEKYSAVVCRSALTYSENLGAVVSEISRVMAPGGRFSVFEPLAGEMEWRADEGVSLEGFLRLERIVSEEREPRPPDRESLRRAFADRFGGVESLVVHHRVTFEGMCVEEIAGEYLHDLPGEMAATQVLGRRVPGEDVMSAVSGFAREASSGKVKGRLPCIFLWGVKAV